MSCEYYGVDGKKDRVRALGVEAIRICHRVFGAHVSDAL